MRGEASVTTTHDGAEDVKQGRSWREANCQRDDGGIPLELKRGVATCRLSSEIYTAAPPVSVKSYFDSVSFSLVLRS